jgi:hypothetical protein
MVEIGDDQRLDFVDWLASADGQAWLGGHNLEPTQPTQARQPTPTQALLDETRRQASALMGASRRPVLRLNLPVETVGALLRANPALAWAVSQVEAKRGQDPERPSPTALAAGLLATATLHAADIEHADPDITWQAAKQATTAAAEAAGNAAGVVDDLRAVLEGLGDKIAAATAQAAGRISREVASTVAAQVADAAATAALKARNSDERVMLRLLSTLVAMAGADADPADMLGSDAATRVENAARAGAVELLETDAGRAGRL